MEDPRTGAIITLPALSFARAWHTATVLPNGMVLILGGIGGGGHVVAQSEIFDPATLTFSISNSRAPVPRAFHTSTLLTDGRLVVAGGVSESGVLLGSVEVWDFRGKVASTFAQLAIGRRNHSALLLPDGRVLLQRGKDAANKPVLQAEIFDPQTFTSSKAQDLDLSNFQSNTTDVRASSPEDRATGVPLDALISIRLSRPVLIQSLNLQSVVMRGPDGVIAAQVVGAEGGMLAFLTPDSSLQYGTVYSVSLAGIVDLAGNTVPYSQFTFTTIEDPKKHNGGLGPPESSGAKAPVQPLPPLQGPSGNTSLSGQIKDVNGDVLPQVSLTVDATSVFSDSNGQFLLTNLTGGHHVLVVDASTANHGQVFYGIYQIGVDLLPGITNVLSYTIWMVRLDMQHQVTIPSPTTGDTVVTTPLIPGLELHIPPNAVITDLKGNTVTSLTITAIPLDKPPFTVPDVKILTYFTVQPGGARIAVTGDGPKGARFIYPNVFSQPPGTMYDFWNYEADEQGWYVYGRGAVSKDGNQVVPLPGVEVYEFTGAMGANPFGPGGSPGQAAPAGNGTRQSGVCCEPIDLSTGEFKYTKTDLVVPDVIPIVLTRTYRTNDSIVRAFGIGTNHTYDIFLAGDNAPATYRDLVLADGSKIHFDCSNPSCTAFQHSSSPTSWYGSTLVVSPNLGGNYLLTTRDGTTYAFPADIYGTNVFKQAVYSITDRYGNSITINRDSNTGRVNNIVSSGGRSITFAYDGFNRITQATDNVGRSTNYTYDAGGRLITAQDANGGTTHYTYDSANRVLTIQDAKDIVYVTNQYDAYGRVIYQTLADGSTYSLNWPAPNQAATVYQTHFISIVACGNCGGGGSGSGVPQGYLFRGCTTCSIGYTWLNSQVTITDQRGNTRTVKFNGSGYTTSDTYASNGTTTQPYAYTYYADNLIKSVTDPLSHVTAYTYDNLGNVLTVARSGPDITGTVTTTYTYDTQFNQLLSVTDPLGHKTTINYDARGNPINVVDALGHTVNATYNYNGTPATISDALGNQTQFGYQGPDLTSISDPMLNVTRRMVDGIGRVLSVTDPLGNTSKFQYNPLNQVTQSTDPNGKQIIYQYDANGNLLNLTDPNGGVTSYTYDSMDRVLTRTDPMKRTEYYAYDKQGNLTSFTDRRGKQTSFSMDPVYDQLKTVTFSDGSTINYTYDLDNRITKITDSIGGVITRNPDPLDRGLASETTPQGSISYGYDNAGRRTSMTVLNQPQITYGYDNANRLTSITQGTAVTLYTYDDPANRVEILTLPTGVTQTYGYDNDSRLTSITYKSNSLDNITYGYDANSRRTTVGGSLARTNLPQPLANASYDLANQLTQWGDYVLSYDLNGNMLNDGMNAYTWDARNQLASVNGASNLEYDGVGRRERNNASTSYLYDGVNDVQELSPPGPSVSANSVTGGVDQFFSRTDSTGTYYPLTDALGSVIALTNSSKAIVTSYTFDPFGNTSASGTANGNPYQYTGRENDSNGLYYYRARYYNPSLGRFISQDPVGLRGGLNNYVYAYDNPGSLRDSTGLGPWQNVYNNPISNFVANHANYLPGICEGGSFRFYGGGVNGGKGNSAGFYGAYHLDDINYSMRGPEGSFHISDNQGTLLEGGARTPFGSGGGGLLYGRKPPYGLEEGLAFVAPPGTSGEIGPLEFELGGVAGITQHGLALGFYGESSAGTPGQVGANGSVGGGWYLVLESAASCLAN